MNLRSLGILLGFWLVWVTRVVAGETASAVATVTLGSVTGITVTSGGSGYTREPTVTMTGGGGSGATAKAVLSGDRVGLVLVLTAGSGYTGSPTVTIEAPPKALGLVLELVPKLTVEGPAGSLARVEWAAELSGPWTRWSNVVVSSEGVVLVDLRAGSERRFYRAVAVPVGPEGFVWIAPGSFVMGSPVGEPDQGLDEIQHPVTLTQGFWLSDHEVTQAEYLAVMGSNPSRFTGDPNRPVESVIWFEAVSYCQKLTELERAAGRITGQQIYRLPTEAEWEYAARAGTTESRYGELDAIAWWGGNSGGQTRPVKQKVPNAWGLYDMMGNVLEWCSDWYGDYPTGAVTDPMGAVTDPTGPGLGFSRVIRGGCWNDGTRGVRPAYRSLLFPGGKSIGLGFRPVLSPVGPKGFVWIAPGSFVMGSPVSEPDRGLDEIQHPVTLTQGFWLSDHEVTQAEYLEVVGSNPSYFTGDPNRPVESVDSNEAVLYCLMLTGRERAAGRITRQEAYRLPTEAEWEYAARAGTTGIRYGELDAIAWWSGNSGSQTRPVKQKVPNAWGLYDMMGNVWEWCVDCYGDYPTGAVTDPMGPLFGFRVDRGGGWRFDAGFVRPALRSGLHPEFRSYDLGFRPVLSSVR